MKRFMFLLVVVVSMATVSGAVLASGDLPEYLLQWGSYGSGDGQFYRPLGVAINGHGAIYVAESGNNRIQKFGVNQPPVADAGGPYLGPLNTPLEVDGTASADPDNDVLSYNWDFGDGTSSRGASVAHIYAATGVYDICLTVNDGQFDSPAACTVAVIYDPDGGFITGGGWIMSPAGAYTVDPSLSGKAIFGFVAKYKKGSGAPSGNTSFQFKAGQLQFEATSYDWLVIAGKDKAKYKGVGTINGGGNFGFMLTATDASPDTLRMKIWDRDSGDVVVYDNMLGEADDSYDGTALSGGSIVVHTDKR